MQKLADNLRPEDVKEIQLMSDLSLYDAIVLSVNNSPDDCFAVFANQQLIAIAGCTATANPWLLATPLIVKYQYHLTRLARIKLKHWLLKYNKLTNAVPVDNHKNIRWLKTLGFEFSLPYEFKPQQYIYLFSLCAPTPNA